MNEGSTIENPQSSRHGEYGAEPEAIASIESHELADQGLEKVHELLGNDETIVFDPTKTEMIKTENPNDTLVIKGIAPETMRKLKKDLPNLTRAASPEPSAESPNTINCLLNESFNLKQGTITHVIFEAEQKTVH